jgi:hypothetical protein
MKQNLILILTILICACSSNTRQKDSKTEKIINILDKRVYLKSKLEFHKDKEVKVFNLGSRSISINKSEKPFYAIFAYRKDGDKNIEFGFEADHLYDKAQYMWQNDSIFKIRLFDSSDESFNSGYIIHNYKKALN